LVGKRKNKATDHLERFLFSEPWQAWGSQDAQEPQYSIVSLALIGVAVSFKP
jgi:hypothetical protein